MLSPKISDCSVGCARSYPGLGYLVDALQDQYVVYPSSGTRWQCKLSGQIKGVIQGTSAPAEPADNAGHGRPGARTESGATFLDLSSSLDRDEL